MSRSGHTGTVRPSRGTEGRGPIPGLEWAQGDGNRSGCRAHVRGSLGSHALIRSNDRLVANS